MLLGWGAAVPLAVARVAVAAGAPAAAPLPFLSVADASVCLPSCWWLAEGPLAWPTPPTSLPCDTLLTPLSDPLPPPPLFTSCLLCVSWLWGNSSPASGTVSSSAVRVAATSCALAARAPRTTALPSAAAGAAVGRVTSAMTRSMAGWDCFSWLYAVPATCGVALR